MSKKAIFYILSFNVIFVIASCSSYKFSKIGVFVNDVDEYFKVVNPQMEKSIKVDLCKNKYFVKLKDINGKILHRDSLEII